LSLQTSLTRPRAPSNIQREKEFLESPGNSLSSGYPFDP
jgi:hypothetical protein